MYTKKYKKYKNRYLNLKNKSEANPINIQYVAEFKNNSLFEQTTDKMLVSDPSYIYDPKEHEPCSRLMKLNLLLDNVATGKWRALLLINSSHVNRNAALVCLSITLLKTDQDFINQSISGNWEEIGVIGVDSGQAGVYDLKYYRDDNVVPATSNESNLLHEDNAGEKWYEMNGKLTMKPTDYGGIIKHGAVSLSGYGDGMYNVYVLRDDKSKITGVKIVFIEPE